MKKVFFVLMLVLGATTSYADELTATQIQLRTEVLNFLKEEGFMPEIDGDGDVKFKKEGLAYYISIGKDESPYYLTFFRYLNYPSEYSLDVIKIAANELNFYKGVKLLCYKTHLRVQADIYMHNVETFKYVFYKLLKQIRNLEEDILDECAKVKETTIAETKGTSIPSVTTT